MKKFAWILVIAIGVSSPVCIAQQEDPAQVMLFGIFHFANPGHDVVKTDQINVMTSENQAYLDALADRLAEFKPTRILLEFEPSRDADFQQRLSDYKKREFELTSNEIYQVGFRVAARTDGATVHGFDERSVQWQAEPLFEHLQDNDQKMASRIDALIADITARIGQAHSTLPLRELLLIANDRGDDRLNRSFYVLTNEAGTEGSFVGADATASWWHRNFRMYALVQRYAQPGERGIVIGGQGHIAILRQLLDDDMDRDAVDVRPLL
jgi:hypothetical protein